MLALLALLALPLPAFADGTDPVAPKEVCANINDVAPKRKCLALIKDGKFDQALAGICNAMSDADPTVACMKAIKNHAYQMPAVAQCQRLSAEDSVSSCFGVIGDKGFSAYEIEACSLMADDDTTVACFKKSGQAGADALAKALAPPKIDPADPYSWRSCERADRDRATEPFDANGKFEPACAPDTLYSWQFPGAVNKLAAAAKKNPARVLPVPYLYTWRTPLGTYGYATDLIRIKLKSSVKFKEIDSDSRNCPIDEKEDQTTVYVSYLGDVNSLTGWSEYLLCSSGPIASWSHDTPEGLAEMTAEKNWVSTHTVKDVDSILRANDASSFWCADCPLFHVSVGDDHVDWTNARLKGNFAAVQKSLLKNPQGEVLYAKGVPADREEHFATKTPGYFNPNSEAALAAKRAAVAPAPVPAPAPTTVPASGANQLAH